MKSKNLIIFLTTIATLLITLFIILSYQKYSLFEITADNFNTKLEPIEEPLEPSGINNVIPDHFLLLYYYDDSNPTNIPSADNRKYNFHKEIISETRYMVDIRSSYTNLNYHVWFKLIADPDNKKIQSWQAINAEVWFYNYSMEVKDVADKLILQEGFIIKRSDLKEGNDILIKGRF